ncbi:kinase-like protein [Trametopsis cervina]|nr:kinase-like protein [Trametopsis cervina]
MPVRLARTVVHDDNDAPPSPASSTSSLDEDDVNVRMAPHWYSYRQLLERRGVRLDTCRDVKQWYQDYWAALSSQGHKVTKDLPGYARACSMPDENALCKDAGLPDNLFRGTHAPTGQKVVIKAVHLYSREYDAVRYLSSPALRADPMNHLIPVYELIEVAGDNLAFIVMEEWSPQLVSAVPCSLRHFLGAIRQIVEHIVFMHAHHMAHLDISVRNLLTDYKGHYAYIDFENCRRFEGVSHPRMEHLRGTDPPPESERGEPTDPYKADVWGLGVLILQTCAMTGYHIPELKAFTRSMLHREFERRPTALVVLRAMDALAASIGENRLNAVP